MVTVLNISIPDECYRVTYTTSTGNSKIRISFAMPGGIIDTMELWVNLEPDVIQSELDIILTDAGFHALDEVTYERMKFNRR